MKSYSYIGNPEFIPKCEFPPRTLIDSSEAVHSWMSEHRVEIDIEVNIPATFVVDTETKFWIADRGSEHVACAREGDVLSAGEVFFAGSRDNVYVDHITNQSTGYCPEPSSWPAVEQSLSSTGIEISGQFEPEFVFRRCTECGVLAIVKENFFVCLVCNADLPHDYNVQ